MSVQADFDSFGVDDAETRSYDPDKLSADNEDYQHSGVLDYFHNERGMAAERIAREVFDGEVSGETIRHWLVEHGLKAPAGTLLSRSGHTGASPMVLLGELARENGDSMLETPLDDLLERYADEVSRRSTLPNEG
ncbi:hypothetical protein [Natronorubrum sp. DTA7]|uniref:hypothetical protein n=1 Tax=Natronorubrum sp. DTA7 TaxID=3447016 RepID=UPI003F83DB02